MTTWCDKWYVTNGMLLSCWSLTECKMWHQADMCATLYGMTYEFWLCREECNCDMASMVVWLVISWWVGCFRLVAWAGFARGVWGREVDTTKVVTTKVYTTNMVTMVWRRVFATLGGWLAGGQWVSVPQDCLQERHDEKSKAKQKFDCFLEPETQTTVSRRKLPCTLSRTWWRSLPTSTAVSQRSAASSGPAQNLGGENVDTQR